MRELVVFGRVGWMKNYAGVTSEDRPVYGGAYNESETGFEAYNYDVIDGYCYGAFWAGKTGELSLRRIRPDVRRRDSLDGVLVILFAYREGWGQVIVGWYRGARVFASPQPGDAARKAMPYTCTAPAIGAVLVPPESRDFVILKGKGATGQSNVTYVLDETGRPKSGPWIREAIAYVRSYSGPNLIGERARTTESISEPAAVDRELAANGGQGFGGTAKERKAIEHCAMQAAIKYFGKRNVQDVSRKNLGYDLLLLRDGEECFVEVKGTRARSPDQVILTPGEVEHARSYPEQSILFVQYGIRLNRSGVAPHASGGKSHAVEGWSPEGSGLKAISYWYDVPKR